jgi:phosphoribosyl 1,2-cyclic phosphate phosphodiesterase
MTLKITLLGCGSSGGVPRLGEKWGACDPLNPKNRRQRCSALIEKKNTKGTTRVLIDTSPDMRDQLLSAGIGELDAVLYTHAHADHVHGLDDLRMIVINMRKRLPVWADAATKADLISRFGYAFETPKGSNYPPILEINDIDGPFKIEGAAGPLSFIPLEVNHGNIDALGFRVADIAYLPDVSEIPEYTWEKLMNLKLWVVDALRYEPHPSHSHLERTLKWIERAKPERSIITNMHVDLDFETLYHELPINVEPAFDMLSITL